MDKQLKVKVGQKYWYPADPYYPHLATVTGFGEESYYGKVVYYSFHPACKPGDKHVHYGINEFLKAYDKVAEQLCL